MLLVAAAVSACADLRSPTGNTPADPPSGSGAQEALFTLAPEAVLAPEPRTRLERVVNRPAITEVHVARLSRSARALLVPGRTLVLNVAPGRRYVATGQRVTDRGDGPLSWSGSLPGTSGSVNLVLTEKGLSGVLRVDGATYAIQPIGNGLVAVARTDRSHALLDHPDRLPEEPAAQRQPPAPIPAPAPGAGPGGGPMHVVYWPDTAYTHHDLLVAYTPSVAAASWDVMGLSQVAIDLANESYENSGIDLAVRLAGIHQVSYSEAGRSHEQHLSYAQNSGDGHMDDLPGARNSTRADVVMLLVDDLDYGLYCGLAPIAASNAKAYSVVHHGCIGQLTFHHELGHVQGARHERANDPSTSPYPYGHGYAAPNGAWRTVMATPAACNGCDRINFWSNPYKNHPVDGQVMGTVAHEDNARVLRGQTAIRDYRTLPAPGNVAHANPGVPNVAPRLSWSAVAGASSYQIYGCTVDNGGYYFESCFMNVGGTSATSWQNYYPSPAQTGSLSSSYNCPRIAMYRVRTSSPEGLSSYQTQINICVY